MHIHIDSQLQHHDKQHRPLFLPCQIHSDQCQYGGHHIEFSLMYREQNGPEFKKPIGVPERGLQLGRLLIYDDGKHVGYRRLNNQVEVLPLLADRPLIIEDQHRFRLEHNGELLWCYEKQTIHIRILLSNEILKIQ